MFIPLSLVCVKNASIYGFFGTSSWDGMSLWIKANGYAREQLEEFYRTGVISREALKAALETFQPISSYYDQGELNEISATMMQTVLCGKVRANQTTTTVAMFIFQSSCGGMPLHSSPVNPSLFSFYTSVSYGLMLWHASDSVHALFMNNMQIVEPLENLYRFVYFGFLGVETKHSSHPMWWTRILLISALFLFFYSTTLIAVFRHNDSISVPIITVCLFALIIHAYTLSVSSLIEFGENNRFRFPVDAAFLVLDCGKYVLSGENHCTDKFRQCGGDALMAGHLGYNKILYYFLIIEK